MLAYFVRYRTTILMRLFVDSKCSDTLGLEELIKRNADARLNARLQRAIV